MQLFRLVIIAGLAYLLYRVVRTMIMSPRDGSRESGGSSVSPMVQDPFCKTYIPLRDAVEKVIEGETQYFCSKECLDKYEQENKRG